MPSSANISVFSSSMMHYKTVNVTDEAHVLVQLDELPVQQLYNVNIALYNEVGVAVSSDVITISKLIMEKSVGNEHMKIISE